VNEKIAAILAQGIPPTAEERKFAVMVNARFPGAKVIRHRTYCATRNPGVDAGIADCNCGAERRAQVGKRTKKAPASEQLKIATRLRSLLMTSLDTMRFEAANVAISGITDEPIFRRIISDIKNSVEEYERSFNNVVNQLEMPTNEMIAIQEGRK